MITIYDHTNSPIWAETYKERFAAHQKTNGAYTYSQEIVKYHIPVIKEALNKYNPNLNTVIMSVGESYNLPNIQNKNLIIQYLHEKFERDWLRVEKSIKLPVKHIFITGRIKVQKELEKRGIACIWLPMSIDKQYILQHSDINKKRYENRIIYFGNKYMGKGLTFDILRNFFLARQIAFDSIYNNVYTRYDGDNIKITRDNIMQVLSNYKYGIGNGRCALEMFALGIKVLISGARIGGIIMNAEDFNKHSLNNFAADNDDFTFSNNILECWNSIDKSITKTTDIADVLPILKDKLKITLDKLQIVC